MEYAFTSVFPFSPFLWGAPHVSLVAAGFKPGGVADAMTQVSDLNLRLDVLVKAVDSSFHAIRRAIDTHPLHTRALHKRQFDVMRYGMILDEVERLVLMHMPRLCGDSLEKVSQEYNALTGGNFKEAPCSAHPIVPEYSFFVYKLPFDADAKDEHPIPLFRLVFRNEAFNEDVRMHLVDHFPLFRLRAVYVSNTKYYPMQRKLEAYTQAVEAAAPLPIDPALEESLNISEIRWLFDAWLMVLEGVAPTWVVDKGVGPDSVSLFLASHRPEGAYNVKEALGAYSTLPVDNRIRCSYYASSERMRRRVQVMERYTNMINDLRDGRFDIPYYGEQLPVADPETRSTRCIRMLLCQRKGARNFIQEDELAAFIPIDKDCEPLQVYNTLAAERLRLWVLKGLLTAELHGVHCLLVEFDTAMVVSECVGLLWGGDEDTRLREVVFHVCKIIVETVEDYVQHSGVIWRAIIVTSDENTGRAAELCLDILEVTQMSKARVELEERQRVVSWESEPLVGSPEQAAAPEELIAEKPIAAQAAPLQICVDTQQSISVDCCPASNLPTPFHPTATFTESVMDRAARCGVRIADSEIYPIFLALADGKDTVLISDVVNLILEKQQVSGLGSCNKNVSTILQKKSTKICRHGRPLWPEHPICAVDGCGVPCNETSVTNFVKSFQRRPYRAKDREYLSTIYGSKRAEAAESLNYVEFSMLLLALAYQ